MMRLPPEQEEQIRAVMRRPEGTLQFRRYTSPDAFAVEPRAGIIWEIVAGGHLFRIERVAPRILTFTHASPGTGTRVASINLTTVPAFDTADLIFSWSPEVIKFYCRPEIRDAPLLQATGIKAARQFQIGRDGSVFQFGDEGIEVMGQSAYQDGNQVIRPTAIQAWDDTLRGIEILWTGRSDQGFIYETVVANLTLSVMVTGFEAYMGTRLLEVEEEGIVPDNNAVFRAFSTQKERETDVFADLEKEAKMSGKSVLRQIVEPGRINFQNYEEAKKAYNRAYSIRLGEIGIDSGVLQRLQNYISYRHRIVHVSPMLSMLNQSKVPPEQPVFSNRALSDAAVGCFSEVIQKLHTATLALRRRD